MQVNCIGFSDSVCTTTKSDVGKERWPWTLTPPWETLVLSNSPGDIVLTRSDYAVYSFRHALGTLTSHLVQERMLLDAATAVEDDRLRDEAADQEHQAVGHVKLE